MKYTLAIALFSIAFTYPLAGIDQKKKEDLIFMIEKNLSLLLEVHREECRKFEDTSSKRPLTTRTYVMLDVEDPYDKCMRDSFRDFVLDLMKVANRYAGSQCFDAAIEKALDAAPEELKEELKAEWIQSIREFGDKLPERLGKKE